MIQVQAIHVRLLHSGAVAVGVAVAALPGRAAAQESNLYAPVETVAFEDVQDGTSDADQNDAAFRVNRRCRVDGSSLLLSEELHVTPLSAGARLDNGLELQLVGVPDGVTVSIDGGSPVAATPDASGWIDLLPSVRSDGFEATAAEFVNTTDAAIARGLPVTIEATYSTGPDLSTTGCPPVELALTRSGVRIDGASTLSANGQPMLARLPDPFEVPAERVPLGQAYPDFLTWLADKTDADGCTEGSCAAGDWYLSPQPDAVVARPSLSTTAHLEPTADCSDGVQNQDETGVDCGGAVCGSCGPLGTQSDPAVSCAQLHTDHPDLASGTYWLQSSAGTFEAQCDMTTDDGGWTLILNYNHLGGTNPTLDVRAASLPLIGSTSLGTDESGSAAWGHAGNALLGSLPFSETMWYCESSAHARVIHFKTASSTAHDYFRTGTGDALGLFDPALTQDLPLYDSAYLPLHSVDQTAFSDEGDRALTEFPFYDHDDFHWGIQGLGDRWECDDFPNGYGNHTYHQVWIR